MSDTVSTLHRVSPRSPYARLLARLRTISTLRSAAVKIQWDKMTYMPRGGAVSAGDQVALLATEAHKRFISARTGKLIKSAQAQIAGFDPASAEAHIVRLAAQDYERAKKLPAKFVEDFARVTTVSETVWEEARETNNFLLFQPHLEKVVALVRQKAELMGYAGHPYNALVDEFEPGMTTDELRRIFTELKARIVPLYRAVQEHATAVGDACLQQSFPIAAQRAFCQELSVALGLDPRYARLDESAHPFTEGLSPPFDVRITTRYDARNLMGAISGVNHEDGHALYELGLDPEHAGTPLSQPISLGVHESQSRLWENCVGKSRAFWSYWYPRLQQQFPDQLQTVPVETFYQAMNKSGLSLIRTESDELTYNLHIIIRFELELALIEGSLKVADLPTAWNDKYEELLGIRPPNDAEGVLQDVHWSGGNIGYFPTYTLGNLISLQLWEKALSEHPDLEPQIAAGSYDTLLQWLRKNVHRPGRRYDTRGLVQKICGTEILVEPFARYLEDKFSALYGFKVQREHGKVMFVNEPG
jgi:carboxypeptidase Taq